MGITLIGGGVRSGKSRYALELAESRGHRPAFIATAEARDDEMRLRIESHRKERGPHWVTVEEPLELAEALRRESPRFDLLLVDCLTLWLSNVLLRRRDVHAEIDELQSLLENWKGPPLLLITNEVGCGIVPDNALARQYRDLAGHMNQTIARCAGEVYWMAFGLPLQVKPGR